MAIHQAPDGTLHDDMEGAALAFLPPGCVLLTAEQVVALRTPTREQAAAHAWGRIKAERDRRKAGGVKIGDKWFHTDDASRIQQLALVMMGAGLPAGLQWKTMDGSFITMPPRLAQQIFAGSAASDQAIFAVAETHRAAMEASTDPASYNYLTGWPKIYGE